MKNNQTKAFDAKREMGEKVRLRATQGFADGGVVNEGFPVKYVPASIRESSLTYNQYADGGSVEPSIGGFLKDRAEALGRFVFPSAAKAADTVSAAPAVTVSQGIQAGAGTAALPAQPAPPVQPAPAPVQPTPQPAFRFADGGPVPTLRRVDGPTIGQTIQNGAAAIGNSIPGVSAVMNAQSIRNNQIQQQVAPPPTPVVAPVDNSMFFNGAPRPTPPMPQRDANGNIMRADGGRIDATSGGHIRGAGSGTSDSIPARLSNGEYVLPADTVKAVGKDNLDAVKDATHTPVNNGIRGAHFDDGGSAFQPVSPAAGIAAPISDIISRAQAGADYDKANPSVATRAATLRSQMLTGDPGTERMLLSTDLPQKIIQAGDAQAAEAAKPSTVDTKALGFDQAPNAPTGDASTDPFLKGSSEAANAPSIRSYDTGSGSTYTSTGDLNKGNLSIEGKSTAPLGSDDPYSHTQQYQQGLQLAQGYKGQLADLRANATQTDAQRAGGFGSGVIDSTPQYRDASGLNGTVGIRGGFNGQTRHDKDRALQAQQLQAQIDQNQAANKLTLRGQDVTSQDNANTVASSMFGHKTQAQIAQSRLAMENNHWDADYGLKKDEYEHKQDQDVLANQQTADKNLHDSLLKSLPTIKDKDGKDVADENTANVGVAGAHAMVQARAKAAAERGDTAGAAKMLQQGTSSLSEDDRDFIPKGLEIKQRFDTNKARVTNDWGGRGSIGATSDNPEDFKPTHYDPASGRVTLGDPKNGRSIHMNDLKREHMENLLFPDFESLNQQTSKLIGNTIRNPQ